MRQINSSTQKTLEYRFELSRQIVRVAGCTDVILFDHISSADAYLKKVIKTIPGYEKCLIAGVPFTAAVRTHILLQTPPLPAEMEFILELYAAFPAKKGLHVWLADPNRPNIIIDGLKLYLDDKAGYFSLIKATFQNPPVASHDYHISAIQRLLASEGMERTLVLPFQTTDWHHSQFAALIEEGKVVLLDSGDLWDNKGRAHEYFTSHGLGYLRPDAQIVSMADIRQPTGPNLREAARRIEMICLAMLKNNTIPFIKLTTNGVLGFGAIPPSINPLLNKALPPDVRSQHFQQYVTVQLKDIGTLADAIVEEYIKNTTDDLGKREFILSGVIVDGEFYPWSVTRAITSDVGAYQGVIASPIIADLGLTDASHTQIIGEGKQLADAMIQGGYMNGYFAVDLIETEERTGKKVFIYHDDNPRRGGRTVADHAAALTMRSYCDLKHILRIPEGADSAEFIFQITDDLRKNGIQVYGSGSIYTGSPTIAIRTLVPLDLLEIAPTLITSIIESYH